MKQELTKQFMGQDDTFWGVEVHEDYSEFTDLGFSGCQCTGFAIRIQEKLGADRVKVMGFYVEDNPEAGVGSICDGHDFAVVDGRYIVDPWLVEVETGSITTHKGTKLELDGQGVFDMELEPERVLNIYGWAKNWTELGSGIPFSTWKREVATRYENDYGLGAEELPEDKTLWEWKQAGETPDEVVSYLAEKYGLVRVGTSW